MESKKFKAWKHELKKSNKKYMDSYIIINDPKRKASSKKSIKASRNLNELKGKINCNVPFKRFDDAGNDLYNLSGKHPYSTGYAYNRGKSK